MWVVPFFVRDAGACRQPCFLAGYRLLVCRGGRLPAGSDGRTWAFRSRRRPASLCFRPWVSVSGGAGVPGGADRLGQWCPYRDFPLSCPSSGFVRANGFQGKFEKIPGTCNVPGIRSVCRSRFISRSRRRRLPWRRAPVRSRACTNRRRGWRYPVLPRRIWLPAPGGCKRGFPVPARPRRSCRCR